MLRLFALVSEGITAATNAFLSDDRSIIRSVRAAEASLDDTFEAMERAARDELVSGVAIDPARARLLVVVLQIVPEMERSGDLVEHIVSRTVPGFSSALPPAARGLIADMGRLSAEMWRMAASAYLERDTTAGQVLRARDDDLDDLHVRLTEMLAAAPLPVAAAIEIGLVARFFERLGDHAVNVARRLAQLEVSGG